MVCVLSSVIATTNGSASKKPSTGNGKRTGSLEVAANVPRNAVAAKNHRNTPRKPTCAARRTQTKIRITLRAGMPDPGSFLPAFFVFRGALGPPLFVNVADAAAPNTDVGLAASRLGL